MGSKTTMKILCDTHVLLWYLQGESQRFSSLTQALLLDESNALYFSTVSIWEIAIKHRLAKPYFNFEPSIISNELLQQGFNVLNITLPHVLAVKDLAFIHHDPFDRLLIAQAQWERLHLFTSDSKILQYNNDFIVNIKSN